MHPLRQFFTLG